MRALFSVLLVTFASHAAAQERDVAVTLRAVQSELAGRPIPDAAQFTTGDRAVASGQTDDGPLAVRGTVRIAGTVRGDVVTVGGDIVVLEGGRITGDAIAIDGAVRREGGVIEGDQLAISGSLQRTPPPSPAQLTQHRLAVTLGWSAVALLLGVGLLVFGGPTLEVVAQTVDEHFGRSFVVGVLATLGAAPALVLACIGLALTVLGILLIPFVIVASILASAGLVALGFLAAARVAGSSFVGRRTAVSLSERGAAVRALGAGILLFVVLWVGVALLGNVPVVGLFTRLAALGTTWAAVTVGLGATLISRGGTRLLRSDETPSAPLSGPPVASWQTPTPVTGVAAVRRPTAPTSGGV